MIHRVAFPINQILFEFTENEQVDTDHLLRILKAYRELGFGTAIDDFDAGYSGLSLLSEFLPDLIKLDMQLLRDIHLSPTKRVIVGNTLRMAHELGLKVVCEGVETQEEFTCLRSLGATHMQGYFIARPEIETLPSFNLAS